MSVYFAESCGYTKIGYSADPTSRVTTITRNGTRPADIPFDAPADLIGWVPGSRQDEAGLHAQFASKRVAGEWFDIDRADIERVIWSDPRGVHMHRMTAVAALVCLEHPELTREQIAEAGVQVEAPSMDVILARLDCWLAPSRSA